VLFLSSGDVSLRYQTREAGQVSGLLTAVPVTGGALLLASFAALGSPPFGLFLSELTIVRAGFAHGSPVFPLLLLALLGLAFVAFARTTAGMVTGSPPAQLASPYRGRAAVAVTAAPLVLGLAALLVLGLWIPAGLDTVLRHSVGVIG
jgi:hydrogenase-4 component F